MSFRLKTILGIALIESVLLLALILVSLDYLRGSNEREFLTRTATAAQLFATTTTDAVLVTDVALLDTLVAEVLTNPGILYARVIGRDQVLAEGGDPAVLARPFNPDQTLNDARDGVFDAYAELSAAGQVYGRVELGFSVDAINAVLREARTHAVSIAMVELALVALFSLILGTYLTRQLGALRSASQRVAEGDLSSRVPVHGRDEIAQTALAFNAMAQRLEDASAQQAQAEENLRALNERLEQRVRERTSELAELNSRLRHQALHDGLTQLPNRSLFHDRLQTQLAAAEREERPFAVALLDLDRFKEINDERGHEAGDAVLREVARRLGDALRDADTVARLGGDEFALILPSVRDAEGARASGDRLLEALGVPLMLRGQVLNVGASIGMALYPAHGCEQEALMRAADAAMYRAKFARSGFCLYQQGWDEAKARQPAASGAAGGFGGNSAERVELRRAVAQNQWVLHYQPRLTPSRRVCGFEALVRWRHPARGLLLPQHFVPRVEQAGLITALTETVLRMALRQCSHWHRNGIGISVSINASAQDLRDEMFPMRVAKTLSAMQAAPAWLQIEFPLRAVMEDRAAAAENIETLDALGVRVGLDGVGAALLEHADGAAVLQGLGIRALKLDRALILDASAGGEGSNAAAQAERALIAHARAIGVEVVAVGVEHEAAWERLVRADVDALQGFYAGRPVPAHEALMLLRCCHVAGE